MPDAEAKICALNCHCWLYVISLFIRYLQMANTAINCADVPFKIQPANHAPPTGCGCAAAFGTPAGACAHISTLAEELKLTASEIHAGVERAMAAQLLRKDAAGKPVVLLESLRLFVQHGLRYCFPATRGEMTRGVPTGYAAPPMLALVVQPNEAPPVCPHKAGKVRGAAFYPLYPTVPEAALANSALYELLVLVDAIRGGSPRERALAIAQLDKRWSA